MTNKQKKNFVDFLQSKSAFYIYMKTYRERHLSINPDSMQDFLRDTEPQLAIIGAFVYPKHELSVYNRDFWLKINEEWLRHLENNKQEEETHSLLVDVDFIDVEKRMISGLGKDTASLNRRASGRLTFNQEHSKLIINSKMKLVALGQSRTTGDVLLMVNNQRGITYSISEHYHVSCTRNVVVGSKDFCQKVSKLLGIGDDYALLDCKVVSKSVNMIVFTLSIKH